MKDREVFPQPPNCPCMFFHHKWLQANILREKQIKFWIWDDLESRMMCVCVCDGKCLEAICWVGWLDLECQNISCVTCPPTPAACLGSKGVVPSLEFSNGFETRKTFKILRLATWLLASLPWTSLSRLFTYAIGRFSVFF